MSKLVTASTQRAMKWRVLIFLAVAVGFWIAVKVVGVFTPAAASIVTVVAGVAGAYRFTRFDPTAEPAPNPGRIKSAEVSILGALIFASLLAPAGYTAPITIGVGYVTAGLIGAIHRVGRRHLVWCPQGTWLGRLVAAMAYTPAGVRVVTGVGGVVLSGWLAMSGISVLPVVLGVAVAFAPARLHWGDAKRDAGTRVAVERALAGAMVGGAWSQVMQTHQRAPVIRMDLTDEGTPQLVLLPLPESVSVEQQHKISDNLTDRLSAYGEYAVHWDTGAKRCVTIRLVPPLPTVVEYDGRPAAGTDGRRIWLGLGKVNREMVETQPLLVVGDQVDVHLDLAATTVHALFVGGTGSGKSVALNLVILQWLRAGHRLVVLDPKRVGFTRLRGKAGVMRIATEPAEMADTISAVRQEMDARYVLLDQHRVDNVTDLAAAGRPPFLLLVIDEAAEAVAQEKVAKDDLDGQAINLCRAEIAAGMSALARLGRAAGIHLIVCTQRPDTADGISGSTKANLEGRLLCGAADGIARGMAGFGTTRVSATPGIRGRGIFGKVNTAPTEVQVAFAPVGDFDRWLPDAGAVSPVDADGDGVTTVVELWAAAVGEADRLAVLGAAFDAGSLTDADAHACGYRDVVHVDEALTAFGTRLLASAKADADEVVLASIRAGAKNPAGTPPAALPDTDDSDEPGDTDESDEPGARKPVARVDKFAHGGVRVDPLPEGEAAAALDALVGLSETKAEVNALTGSMQMALERAVHGVGDGKVTPGHLVFAGPPGTGKTTVARILGSLYRDVGVLRSGHVVEVDRAGLVAGYIGQTAGRVESAFADARGGVLFIDEAYALAPTGTGSDFGREAIEALLKRAEDCRHDTVVILAGYEREMEHLLSANPGLRSRFPTRVHFPAYEPGELGEIFEATVVSRSIQLDASAREAVPLWVGAQDRASADWGNARSVRDGVDAAIRRMDARLLLMPHRSPVDLFTLTAADIIPAESSAGSDVSGSPLGDVGGLASPADWLAQFTG